jgi:acetyl esterase/lipase/lysophospholipase L1-like esterase
VPEERLTGWRAERHAEKVVQAKTGKAQLVMIGDSITHNWERQESYAELFSPYNTLNLGFGGDRTENVLWRIQNGEIDNISPKLVTMMIGTNNIPKEDSPADIAAGIKAIVAELRRRLPEARIVVFSIFPRNHHRVEGDLEVVRKINEHLPKIADDKHVFHVDVTQAFLDDSGQPNPMLYGRDLLHLSNTGYDVWYKALQPILADHGLKAKGGKPVARAVKEKKTADPFRDPHANPTDDPNLPRVLIIGDSISVGYTCGVRKLLDGKANVHRVKGNCRYSAYGVENIDAWLGNGDWDLIHFNFGLWDWYGWSQDPKATPESYKANLEKIVTKLKATGAKLIFGVTTPPCIGPETKVKIIITEQRAKEFNDASLSVMKKHGIEINDLYTPIAGKRTQYQLGANNVHYTNEAKALQAKQVAQVIEAGLKRSAAKKKPAEPAAEAPVIRLWPIAMVGGEQNRLKENFRTNRRGIRQLSGIKDPNLTVFKADSRQPTPAVVYCPGGGYMILDPRPELIQRLNTQGITVFMLKYTIPDHPDAAFQDIQRAMRLVRHQAKKWNVDPNRIGVVGNSAGSHLSARLTQNYDQKTYEPIDAADKLSCEPQFAVLQCAAYFQGRTMDKEFDAELFHMKNKTAPTFLTYSTDDKFCKGGVEYAKRLTAAGGPIELKLFEKGGHGMEGCDWFSDAAEWMEEQKIVR